MKQSRMFPLWVVIIGLALLAAACGGSQPPPPVSTETAPAPAPPPAAAQAPPPTPPQETAPPAAAEQATPPPRPHPREHPRQTRHEAEPETGQAEAGRAAVPPAPMETPPPPQPVIKTVPAGTQLDVAFVDAVSSKTSKVGDSFRARVNRDVVQDGVVVIPTGSVVVGSVTEAVPLKTIGGTAKLSLDFSKLELPSGAAVPIQATLSEQGKSETKKDAATIGGAAAGGALLGRLLSRGNKTKGTILGAVVGAAAGTAIAAKTKGQEIQVPAGTEVKLQLGNAVQVPVSQ